MLSSMRSSPTPTRAEVSDIANSVADGADAVVLSEDIGCCEFTSKAINICANIIQDVEQDLSFSFNWQKARL